MGVRIDKREYNSITGKSSYTTFVIENHNFITIEYWEMSDVQKTFIKLIKSADGITFREAKKEIPSLRICAVNILLAKGYIKKGGRKDFNIDITSNGVVKHVISSEIVYRLAK